MTGRSLAIIQTNRPRLIGLCQMRRRLRRPTIFTGTPAAARSFSRGPPFERHTTTGSNALRSRPVASSTSCRSVPPMSRVPIRYTTLIFEPARGAGVLGASFSLVGVRGPDPERANPHAVTAKVLQRSVADLWQEATQSQARPPRDVAIGERFRDAEARVSDNSRKFYATVNPLIGDGPSVSGERRRHRHQDTRSASRLLDQ